MTPFRLQFKSIDEYLGEEQCRFFISDYKSASYSDLESHMEKVGMDTIVQGRCAISHSQNSSSKHDTTHNAHISTHMNTIDAVVLSYLLSIKALKSNHLIKNTHSFSLQQIRISSGSKPIGELSDIDYMVEVKKRDLQTIETRVKLGHFINILLFSKECRPSKTGETMISESFETLGNSNFKMIQHTISDLDIDMERLRATGRVNFKITISAGLFQATELCSFIESFLVCLQFAQVMLYELDGIKQAPPLWMIRSCFNRKQLLRWDSTLTADVSLESPEIVQTDRNSYRTAKILGKLGGMEIRSEFAYSLKKSGAL
jgi:hypothetical protein